MSGNVSFFRVEGTLISRPTLSAAAWLAANAPELAGRLARLGGVALATPFLVGPLADRESGSKLAWRTLDGMTEDRLLVLGEEYARRFVLPNLRDAGTRLIKEAKTRGDRVVLFSDNLSAVMDHVAGKVGADELICNRAEVKGYRLTGELVEPIVTGTAALRWAKEYAQKHGMQLAHCFAYGALEEDGLLLSAAGNPCAVYPTRGLRQIAREQDWPIVEG